MIKKILILFSLCTFSLSEFNNPQNSFNEFGISLFQKINSNIDSDFMISPTSISHSLMMVNYGASGSTSEDILSVLNLTNTNLNSAYAYLKKYTNSLNDNFSINNSIWIQNDRCYAPNLNYAAFIDSVFRGNLSYVDFYNERVSIIKNINRWIDSTSYGTIKEIVSDNDIKKHTTQALLNSIYFKSNWQTPFDSSKTKREVFFTDNYYILETKSDIPESDVPDIDQTAKIKDSIKISMMNHRGRYFHYKNKDFHLLEIPYQEKGLSMLIFLPSPMMNLDIFINTFSSQILNSSLKDLKFEEGNISIPKFQLEFSTSLKDPLKLMGMTIPFSPKEANFDKFWNYTNTCKKYPPKNYIDVINHKTYIDIDENGTEASAATAIIISRVTSIRPSYPFHFNANRPFLYLIYDKINNNIIFLGKYSGK